MHILRVACMTHKGDSKPVTVIYLSMQCTYQKMPSRDVKLFSEVDLLVLRQHFCVWMALCYQRFSSLSMAYSLTWLFTWSGTGLEQNSVKTYCHEFMTLLSWIYNSLLMQCRSGTVWEWMQLDIPRHRLTAHQDLNSELVMHLSVQMELFSFLHTVPWRALLPLLADARLRLLKYGCRTLTVMSCCGDIYIVMIVIVGLWL